jgi:hypothetical protein
MQVSKELGKLRYFKSIEECTYCPSRWHTRWLSFWHLELLYLVTAFWVQTNQTKRDYEFRIATNPKL